MPYNSLHKIQPYIHRNRFYNIAHDESKESHFMRGIVMYLKSWWNRSEKKLDIAPWVAQDNAKIEQTSKDLNIIWLGHSTFLIQIGGFNIITDPVFWNITSFFKRILPLGISLDKIPNIDYVLLSHNHRDHMDSSSLYFLNRYPGISYLVPQGDRKWFTKRDMARTIEFSWWERATFANPDEGSLIEFHFLPAYHWSGRGVFDRNRSLWGSWMIRYNGINIYFGGDTGYSAHFKCIQKEFGFIDVAILPIGPCEPKEWMLNSHIGPEEALKGFVDLNASNFIPMHWGTFNFGVEDIFYACTFAKTVLG